MEKCLVIAAIGDEGSDKRKRADKVLNMIKRALNGRYEVTRADQIARPGLITAQIIRRLIDDPLVIVDLTHADPNVYYELAVRHASGKPFVHLIEKGQQLELAKDVADMGRVDIDANDLPEYEGALRASVDAINADGYRVSTPIDIALIPKLFDRLANEPQKAIMESFKSVGDGIVASLTDLKRVAQHIEEGTRKPLKGFDQVLAEIYSMLRRARIGGPVWFVGMTLGLGPPHFYRQEQGTPDPMPGYLDDEDDKFVPPIQRLMQQRWPGLPRFKDIVEEINGQLTKLLEAAPDPIVVCLSQDRTLKNNFLNRLAKRANYEAFKPHIDCVAKEIRRLHDKAAKAMAGKPRGIAYLKSIPIQILIVEVRDDNDVNAQSKTACVVFHVGTDTIATGVMENGETGFYTELETMAEMFQSMARSHWETAFPGEAHGDQGAFNSGDGKATAAPAPQPDLASSGA